MRGNFLKIGLAMLAAAGAAVAGEAKEFRVALAVAPLEIVQEEEAFRAFARKVDAAAEGMLADPAALDDPATLRTLLSTRVHLAHHFGDDARAISTAAWIRSLQTDRAERAFAGLTTFAAVAARQRTSGAPTSREYLAAFEAEFSQRIAALAQTAEIKAMLKRQRDKIASLSLESLLSETQNQIAPSIGDRKWCSLAEADQLVRVRHRIVSILPTRDATLRALDAEIARR